MIRPTFSLRTLPVLLLAVGAAACDRDKDAIGRALADNDVSSPQVQKVSSGHYSFTGESGSGELCKGSVKANPDADASARWLVEQECDHLKSRGEAWLASERSACQGGNQRACTHVGAWMMDVVGSPVAEVEARALLAKACESGNAVACGRHALLLYGARGGERDYAGAREHETRACEGGAFVRCDPAGTAWMWDQAGPPDFVRGRKLFQLGCNDRVEFQQSCLKLGMAYHRGDGGPQDDGLARRVLQRACKLGFPPACEAAKDPAYLDRFDESKTGDTGAK